MLFQCHQESTQFNIVLVLLNRIFNHKLKLKKLSKLRIFFVVVFVVVVQCQGYENCYKIEEEVRKHFDLF